VESHTAYHAVIVYENKPGPAAHILLGFLTLFTCGLFLIVWIIVAASASERRVTLRVDEFGNVTAS
jgi:hypothetical protein